MVDPKIVCKRIIFSRCINAIGISVIMQQVLLAVFLLFVNFSLLHPLEWIRSTLGLLFSFYTWCSIIPLIVGVVMHGIVLGKLHLAEKRYYDSRYRWFLHNMTPKLIFISTHVMVGFLTTSLYSSFLHLDYRQLIYKCYENDCINSYYGYLMSIGIFSGCYHFFKLHLRDEPRIHFSTIQPEIIVQIRGLLYSTLYKSVIKSFLPTLIFTVLYWLVSGHLNRSLGGFFDAESDDRLESFVDMTFNTRLLFYAWILSAQIMSNMYIMEGLYAIFLAEKLPLVIKKNQMAFANSSEITLAEALGVSNMFVVQCLAANTFCQIATEKVKCERKEIFELSEPGRRPLNWTQLSSQCLGLIQNFTEDLSASMNKISAMKSTNTFAPITSPSQEIIAEKILLHRYNELHGIRSIATSPVRDNSTTKEQQCCGPKLQHNVNVCQRLNARCEQFSRQLQQTLRNIRRKIPGVVYMFEEPDGAQTVFLLDNSLPIVFLTQGLAGICAASIVEDDYGVVQFTLPNIIKTLVNLKIEVDKLNNININGKRLDRKFQPLKMALKRSLHIINSDFGQYFSNIIRDPAELRQLQSALSYQD